VLVKKVDREKWIENDIARNCSVLHRVTKIVDGLDAETSQVLYCGYDRREARLSYHSIVCKQNEAISHEAIFDAGTNDFKADAVIHTFSVAWSGR
jgi:hypothetical protein